MRGEEEGAADLGEEESRAKALDLRSRSDKKTRSLPKKGKGVPEKEKPGWKGKKGGVEGEEGLMSAVSRKKANSGEGGRTPVLMVRKGGEGEKQREKGKTGGEKKKTSI